MAEAIFRLRKRLGHVFLSQPLSQCALRAHVFKGERPESHDSGKVIAKAKGVRCEAGYEGRQWQNSAPTNRSHVKPQARVRPLNKPKPDSCTESFELNMVGIRGKECMGTRGGFTGGEGGRILLSRRQKFAAGSRAIVTTNCEKSAEAIAPQKSGGRAKQSQVRRTEGRRSV